jgi:MFS family permease
MLAAPFTGGVGIYAFYALQPYLLQLYGDSGAYGIAGLAAAIIAGAQIVGGLIVPHVRRLFSRRTDALLIGSFANVVLLVAIGMTGSFWLALLLLVVWAMAFAVELPLRQAFLNGVIPSEQRATVLSFDNLMASAGGVVIQPGLGRVADVYGYPASYVASAAITALAIPFVVLARRENAPSDPITVAEPGSATSIT